MYSHAYYRPAITSQWVTSHHIIWKEFIVNQTKQPRFKIQQLEERIAPSIAPGQLGYEGQPGNQGNNGSNGSNGTPNGLLGYEGQPGNQGG